MKTLLFLILIQASNAFATLSPLHNLENNLQSLLEKEKTVVGLSDIQKRSLMSSNDVDVAVQDYLIAKKNVSIARASFNPLTTGHLLGLSMGLTYIWGPLVVDALLSLPTKIYTVKRNSNIALAASFNAAEVRDVLRNEVSHLYFEILTHEAILNSIDLEVEILNYQLESWVTREFPVSRQRDLEKWLIRLNMERADILKIYIEELSALNILLKANGLDEQSLEPIKLAVQKTWYESFNLDENRKSIIVLNPRYQSARYLEKAAHNNVKAVKWSIISPSGISFSYKSNVKVANNEKEVARLRTLSVAEAIKNNMYLQKQLLDSSVNISENYRNLSQMSLLIFSEGLTMLELGQLGEDNVIELSLTAIRDFRSKIVSHYISWASLDDFSKSINYKVDPSTLLESQKNNTNLTNEINK